MSVIVNVYNAHSKLKLSLVVVKHSSLPRS